MKVLMFRDSRDKLSNATNYLKVHKSYFTNSNVVNYNS